MSATSVYNGLLDGLRIENSQTGGDGLSLTSQPHPNAAGVIAGNLSGLLGGSAPAPEPRAAGLMPPFAFGFTAGNTELGDVTVNLSPAEQNVAAKFSGAIDKVSNLQNRMGPVLFWGAVACVILLVLHLFKRNG